MTNIGNNNFGSKEFLTNLRTSYKSYVQQKKLQQQNKVFENSQDQNNYFNFIKDLYEENDIFKKTFATSEEIEALEIRDLDGDNKITEDEENFFSNVKNVMLSLISEENNVNNSTNSNVNANNGIVPDIINGGKELINKGAEVIEEKREKAVEISEDFRDATDDARNYINPNEMPKGDQGIAEGINTGLENAGKVADGVAKLLNGNSNSDSNSNVNSNSDSDSNSKPSEFNYKNAKTYELYDGSKVYISNDETMIRVENSAGEVISSDDATPGGCKYVFYEDESGYPYIEATYYKQTIPNGTEYTQQAGKEKYNIDGTCFYREKRYYSEDDNGNSELKAVEIIQNSKQNQNNMLQATYTSEEKITRTFMVKSQKASSTIKGRRKFENKDGLEQFKDNDQEFTAPKSNS